MAFLVGVDIEIGASQLDAEVVAKFTHKCLVAVGLVAAQVEVAVGSAASTLSRATESAPPLTAARIFPLATAGMCLWIYLSVSSSNAFIINLSIGKFKKSISINQNIFLPLQCLCNKKQQYRNVRKN